jgi:amino acid adenylation domain-containing protein
METVDGFLSRLRNLSVKLWREDGDLRYRARKGILTPELKAELAERKEEILSLLSGPQTALITPLEMQQDYAVSHAQRRMWVLAQDEASAAAYNIPLTLLLEGPLDRGVFEAALSALVRRHESLRTTFINRDGELRQRVCEHILPRVDHVDLTCEADAEERARELAHAESVRPFDLTNGPLLRTALLRFSETRHILLLTLHHIICDGWSLNVMIRDFGALYEGLRQGAANALPALPIQYRDYSNWHAQVFLQPGTEIHRNYWKRKLQGRIPILNLPADYPRPPVQTFNGAEIACKLNRELTRRLSSFCREQNASLFMGLTAIVKVLLHRYTGQEDIILGTPIAGRINADLDDQVGLYLNTVVLRDHVQSEMSFKALLQQVKQTATEAYEHQIYPFDLLVGDLDAPRDVSRSPLFDTLIILQTKDDSPRSIDNLQVHHLPQEVQISKFDLSFDFAERDGEVHLGIGFNADLFLRDRINRMSGHFVQLVNSILENPDQRICLLNLLPNGERDQLLHEFNNTATNYCSTQTVTDLFETQVTRTADALAISCEGKSLTYGELNVRANQLAQYLRSRGVSSEVPVGVCLERSIDLLVGLLGILKAGGFYVPLDPRYPKERLDYMAANANLSVLITQESLRAEAPAQGAAVVCLDTDWPEISSNSGENIMSGIVPANSAYVIYTSGSTGQPKGVQISHQSLVNLLVAMGQKPGLAPDDILLAVTTVSFDIAGLELYLPLITGARIVLLSTQTASDGALLLQALNDSNATVLQSTPATWQMLLSSGWKPGGKLKILCGGEALPGELARRLAEAGDQVWNLYGPTETTIWSAVCQVKDGIGLPLANTQFYVLDRSLQLVPVGVPGELHIGGDGLARCYLHRPDLTAERFIPNPFGDGDRLYKTGDLVQSGPDGNLRFLGRVDSQVKVRGFRIELGEIEAALERHPAVKTGIVAVREDAAENQQLIAFILPNPEEKFSADEVRTSIQQTLPHYMIPSVFVVLDALPISPSGKIDRRALPAPDKIETETPYLEPRNDTEQTLAAIWQDVLKVERVGIHDNFFEMGGNSLKAAKAIFMMSSALNASLRLTDLFREPTIEGLGRIAATKPKPIDFEIQPLEEMEEAIKIGVSK